MAIVTAPHSALVAAENRQTNTPSTFSASKNEIQSPESTMAGPVKARLSFFKPPANGEQPYNWAGEYADNPPNGIPRNFGPEDHEVVINDIRGRETQFDLDRNAFAAFVKIESALSYGDWNSEDAIKGIYYPEVEQLLLQKLPGASRVHIFDHTIRRPNHNRAPVMRVHVDQTGKSTEARVRHHLPDEAEELLRGRYRIVNVWRPLNGPVQAYPLAMADSATVRDEDLVAVEHRYPQRTGETAGVKFDAGQTWYYLSEMRNDERLLLKCFDSDTVRSPSGRAPHSAFEDPRTPAAAPGRESIEVRALVFG